MSDRGLEKATQVFGKQTEQARPRAGLSYIGLVEQKAFPSNEYETRAVFRNDAMPDPKGEGYRTLYVTIEESSMRERLERGQPSDVQQNGAVFTTALADMETAAKTGWKPPRPRDEDFWEGNDYRLVGQAQRPPQQVGRDAAVMPPAV